MKKLNNKLISGYLMLVGGIILILLTMVNLIFHWHFAAPPVVFGIIFVAIATVNIKKNRTEDISK